MGSLRLNLPGYLRENKMKIALTRQTVVTLMFTVLLLPSAQAETLQQSWEIALQASHSLKSVQQNTAASVQNLEAAKTARLPGISVKTAYTMLDNAPASKMGSGEITVGEDKSLSFSAMTTLPLYSSGKISHGIDAANASFQATRTQEWVEIQSLKLKVAESYVGVLRAKKALQVANTHVESLDAHAHDVENMYKQDLVSRNDLLTAQVALAEAQQQAIKAENNLDLSRSTYNRLLGRSMEAPVELVELSPEEINEPLKVLTEKALIQRQELIALQYQIRALRLQASSIRAETGPQVSLSGGYDYKENQYQVHEGQWVVNLGLQWNLFDGGSIRHKSSANESQAAAIQEQYDDLRSLIALQVRQYWLDVQETEKRIQVSKKAIDQAEENLKVNRDRYESGLSTNTEVLDAETLRSSSQNNYANAIYDAALATLRLHRACGSL